MRRCNGAATQRRNVHLASQDVQGQIRQNSGPKAGCAYIVQISIDAYVNYAIAPSTPKKARAKKYPPEKGMNIGLTPTTC